MTSMSESSRFSRKTTKEYGKMKKLMVVALVAAVAGIGYSQEAKERAKKEAAVPAGDSSVGGAEK